MIRGFFNKFKGRKPLRLTRPEELPPRDEITREITVEKRRSGESWRPGFGVEAVMAY